MPLDIDSSEVEKWKMPVRDMAESLIDMDLIDGEQYEVFLDDLTKELADEGIDINDFHIVERLDKGSDKGE